MTTRTGEKPEIPYNFQHIHKLVRITDTYFRYKCVDPHCGRKLRIMSGVLVGRPQPIVAMLDRADSEEALAAQTLPEPSAYEESIARRTGSTVEQLRKEADEASTTAATPAATDLHARVAADPSYIGLTDCQICILESLKVDGPAPSSTLVQRCAAELAMAGVSRVHWFSHKEVMHAIELLEKAGRIRWSLRAGGFTLLQGDEATTDIASTQSASAQKEGGAQ